MAKKPLSPAGYKFGIAVAAVLSTCVLALIVAGTAKLIQIMFL